MCRLSSRPGTNSPHLGSFAMAANASPTAGKAPTGDTTAGQAVMYSKGTAEWKILNRSLGYPAPRARRADAHQPTTREVFTKAIEFYGKVVPEVDHGVPFPYSKLDKEEIRILRLYPSKHPDDPLKADLFKRKLDEVKIEYEALSYCWGTDGPTHEIQIRDLNAASPSVRDANPRKAGQRSAIANTLKEAVGAITHTEFKIRKNLHDALKRLRGKYSDVYIWVDAICINQSPSGAKEKQGQLAMMARIYNCAATVSIWLGEDHGEAKNAFELAAEIMNYKKFDKMFQDPHKMAAWRDLTTIMRADWFSRRWIIQEIALSRNATIHCGEHSLHWDDFADAVSLLVENIELMRVGYRDELFDDVEISSASILIQTLGNICRKSDDDEDRGEITSRLLDVETLVSTLLNFQATYPRDTIYSILSLAKDPPRIKEDWQELHLPQLQKVQDDKRKRMKNELDELNEKKARWEGDLKDGENVRRRVEARLHDLEEKRRQMIDASAEDREEEARRLGQAIQRVREDELQAMDRDFKDLDTALDQCRVRIKQLVLKYNRTKSEVDDNPISLLPNYTFSPRDLFIAFVTRSIQRTGSLDIICRHWAPELKSVEDGAGEMPSWISSRSKAPFGLPGTARGRQNGENFVTYLPHDQRRRYAASGSKVANIEMLLDPRLSHDETSTEHIAASSATDVSIPSSRPTTRDSGAAPPVQTEPSSTGEGTSANGEASATAERPTAATAINGEGSSSHPAGVSERDSVKIKLDGSWLKRLSVRRALGRLAALLGGEGEGTRSQDDLVSPAVAEAEPPVRKEADTSNDWREEGQRNVDGDIMAQGQPQPDVTAVPPAAPAAEKGTKKPSVGANFPSASSWTPGPHRLSGILVVKGFVLGVVKSQSDVMRGGIIPGAWVSKLGWKKGRENHVPDTLWRLLVADRMSQGARPPLWYKRACLHGLVDGRVSDNAGNIHPVTPADRKISELTTMYFKRVESVVWNRRVIELAAQEDSGEDAHASTTQPERTNAGTASGQAVAAATEPAARSFVLHGLGPEGSEVGYILCVLYGCSVPVVLRKAGQQRVKDKILHEVVGEAYVHGIMDGEFMIKKWTDREQEFYLA